MNKVNLLLPFDAMLTVEGRSIDVTAIRIRKLISINMFEIQVLRSKNQVFVSRVKNMGIKVFSAQDFMQIEVLENKELIFYIKARKIVEEKEIKNYIKTLII